MAVRKRAISIRMSATDVTSVKKMAKRLGARDSDVIRCAVKMMMSKLGPLADASVRGSNLVPVFIESGSDLFRHFELDATRLESILNEGAPEECRVDHDDIQMLAMTGVQRSFIKLRLGAIGLPDFENERHDSSRVEDSVRQYLSEKYIYRAAGSRHININHADMPQTNAAGLTNGNGHANADELQAMRAKP